MRILISLTSNNAISLQKGYLSNIQAAIYNLVDKLDAHWLHEKGFLFEKRSFKLFTFSDFLEKSIYDKPNETFRFNSQKLSFYISSPVDWILQQVASNTLKSDVVRIGSNLFTVESISVMKEPMIKSSPLKIKAISPLTIHSTIDKDNKKLTHFYTPFEQEFSELINQNLRKKWTAMHNAECSYNITIKPLFQDDKKQRITYFGTDKQRRTLIKGWLGEYEINGEPEFIRFALDAGLGARNSQGFGMFGVI